MTDITLWPIHLHPLPDELLSSWLVRLAHAHGLRIHAFTEIMLGHGRQIWTRDIDRSADNALLELLSEKTATSIECVRSATLGGFSGILSEHIGPSGSSPWIMPIGIYHRTRRRYGLQYCPRCLFFDQKPYFRKKWRLALFTQCDIHQTLLQDRCYVCGAPVIFFRGDILNKEISEDTMTQCWNCAADLCRAPSVRPNENDWESGVALQSLIDFIPDGWAIAGQQCHDYSLNFLPVLHQIVRLLGHLERYKGGPRLIEIIKGRLGIDLSAMELPSTWFEQFSVKKRHKLLFVALWLLMDWPHRFLEVCQEVKFSRWIWQKDGEPLPYWFDIILKTSCLNLQPYALTAQEADSIAKVIANRKEPVTCPAISRMVGQSVTNASEKYRKSHTPISRENFEFIINWLEGQAALLPKNSRRQITLRRDRVIFQFMALSGLPATEIVKISINDALELVKGLENDVSARLGNILSSYLKETRPLLSFKRPKEEITLFLSPYGQKIKALAIRTRWKRYIAEISLKGKNFTLSSLRIGHRREGLTSSPKTAMLAP